MTLLCPACLIENTPGALLCSVCGYSLSDSDVEEKTSCYPLALPSGTQLKQGTYQIEYPLGQGGFGIAYKALNLKTKKTVAIKEFFPERSSRQGTHIIWPHSISPTDRQAYIEEFIQEGYHLSLCSPHPNIVFIYEWFKENNTGYLVLEFIKGKSLDNILKEEKRLSESRVKKYFIKIAMALKVAHNNQLLHRDIKPDNIIINEQDEPVLIDFGSAREYIAGKTQSMTAIAAVGYAPLEQLISYAKRSPSMDFYAVCATMYELLTGKLPAAATERAVQDNLIPPRLIVSSISEQMESILLTGLKMRAEERFQIADDLIDALQGKFISPALRRARQWAHQQNFPEAIKAYQSCLHDEPNNSNAMSELALILLYFDEEQAEKVLLQVLDVDNSDSRSYGILGLIYCRQSKWKEALNLLTKATALSPNESWLQANLAWAAGKSGDWQLAQAAVRSALELDDQSPFILGLQAWIAFNQSEWKTVIRYSRPAIFKAKQLVDKSKKYLWIYPCLIMALEKAIKTPQSTDVKRTLQEYLNDDSNNDFALGLMAWKEMKQENFEEALKYLKHSSLTNTSLKWILLNKAITYEYLNDFSSAISVYQYCIDKFFDDIFSYFRCGTLFGIQGNFQEAKFYLEKAIDLKANSPEVYHNLGWTLLSLSKNENTIDYNQEIIFCYRHALELYQQQGKYIFAENIKQNFQRVGIRL